MTGEHRILFLKLCRALGRDTRIAADQFAHENKWRPMGQAKEVTSGE